VREYASRGELEPHDLFRATLRAHLETAQQVRAAPLSATGFFGATARTRLFIQTALTGYPLARFPAHATTGAPDAHARVTVGVGRAPRDARGHLVAGGREAVLAARAGAPSPSALLRAVVVADALAGLPLEPAGAFAAPASGPVERLLRARGRDGAGARVDGHARYPLSLLDEARVARMPAGGGDWRDLPNVAADLGGGTVVAAQAFVGVDAAARARFGVSEAVARVAVCACQVEAGAACTARGAPSIVPWTMAHTAGAGNSQNGGNFGVVNFYGHAPVVLTRPRPTAKTGAWLHPWVPRILTAREAAGEREAGGGARAVRACANEAHSGAERRARGLTRHND